MKLKVNKKEEEAVDPSTLSVAEQVNLLIRKAYADKNGIDLDESSTMTADERTDFDAKVKSLQDRMKWTVIDGDVYDITNYIQMHPGGVKKINLGVGKDSTVMFHRSHKGIRLELTPLPALKFGELFSKQKAADKSGQSLEARGARRPPKDKKPTQPTSSAGNSGFLSIPNIKLGIL